ncbi:serine/threonine-protein kinase [Mycolicibacterium sp. BiH015]|uniref:serine/threonine-protein kinase n=1 Tax=Mycolicibacterium sp. BiH015 TaxID=3018808 RepID=UPI0022DF007D|nr:serine/threonine-protein kinase [Mycolicibacterium sp. BiH015]MDA2893522.1 serine/threonine-protein kinase [Mycolicibacterium sp. BiH015]
MNFGSYELRDLAGRGAAGEVWRAYDPRAGRTVALRLLPPELSDDAVSQLVGRLRIAAALNDPHLVPIHDFGQWDGRLFVDMRFIEGRALTSILAAGAMPVSAVVSLADQVASALRTAHRAGLVHGSVRPSNIMITGDGFAYLADLGVCPAEVSTAAAWPYLAPELFDDTGAGPASDVYSLACLVFECLTGTTPFPGATLQSLAVAHLSAPPPRPSRHPGVPAVFDDVIAHGMAKSPPARFASAPALATALRAAAHSGDSSSQDAPPMRSSRYRRVLIAAGGAAAAVTLSVGTVMLARTAEPVTPNSRSTEVASSQQLSERPTVYGTQLIMPFDGLDGPKSVAVSDGGDVLVADMNNARVVRLAATGVQTTLPIPGLTQPVDVSIDRSGNVYVADFTAPAVVMRLQADGAALGQVPFVDVTYASSVAADDSGNVYANSYDVSHMVMVPGGIGAQKVVPFNGVNVGDFDIDSRGDIYAVDINDERVVRIDAAWTTQTVLPFTDADPAAVAVGADGSVYVSDISHRAVMKWTPGTEMPVRLPITGLLRPTGIAVDAAGNVYVSDLDLDQVLQLPVI